MKTASTVTIRINAKAHRLLKGLAELNGITITEMIDRVARFWSEENQNAEDCALCRKFGHEPNKETLQAMQALEKPDKAIAVEEYLKIPETLRAEFDTLLADMQTPQAKKGLRASFTAGLKLNRMKQKKPEPRWSPTIPEAPIPVELAFPNGKPGDHLAGIRCRENLTQDEMAKKLGICRSNLSAMERGKRPIGKDLAKKIAAIFGGSYKSFL